MELPLASRQHVEHVEVVAQELEEPSFVVDDEADDTPKIKIEDEDSVVLLGTGGEEEDDEEETEGHATVVPLLDETATSPAVPTVQVTDDAGKNRSTTSTLPSPTARQHAHEEELVVDSKLNNSVQNFPKKIISGSVPRPNEIAASSQQVSGGLTNSISSDLEKTEKEIEKMWAGRSNVMVAVRCRPMSKRELARSHKVVFVMDNNLVAVVDNQNAAKKGKEDILRQGRSREKRYAFDHAFGPEVGTQQVYEHTTKLLIDGVIIGYNATVFAYGPTGAGKTFTMLGGAATAVESQGNSLPAPMPPPMLQPVGKTPSSHLAALNELGIMVLTMRDLFAKVQYFQQCSSNTRQYKVTCSFLEVYNEMIRDLLTPSTEYLDLREDPVKGPIVAGLSEVEASSADDVMRLLRKGNARRSTEGTGANEASSRSHAVLQVTVEQVDDGRSGGAMANVTIGKLSLIDLAGSERASATQNRGLRQKEGANINRSLLALGNCINALREGGRGTFVPYRDSKLTRLLKDSLGGNCRTVMIAAVSPSSNQHDETLNTLKYANRAKNIKTKVERNVLNVDYHVTEYVNLIARLKCEITSLRNKLKKPATFVGSGMNDELIAQKLLGGGKLSTLEQQQLLGKGKTDSGSSADVRKTVEKRQMALLREQLVLNFKERMQLRRSLIEIEAQNIANKTELEMHQLAIQQWETRLEANQVLAGFKTATVKPSNTNGITSNIPPSTSITNSEANDDDDDNDDDNLARPNSSDNNTKNIDRSQATSNRRVPEWVKVAREESAQLQRANLNNSNLKHDIEERLKENQEQAEALRKQMDTRITTEERRELMELEYRIGMLELENMELERSRMLHRSSMAHKDTLIQRLLWQLQLRDNVISEQRKLLESTELDESKLGDAVEEFTMEIEPLKMLESLPKGTPITPVTPHRTQNGVEFMGHIAKLRQTSYGFGNEAKSSLRPAGDEMPPSKPQVFPLHRLEEELQRIEQGQGASSKGSRRANTVALQKPSAQHQSGSNNNNNNNDVTSIPGSGFNSVKTCVASSSQPQLKANVVSSSSTVSHRQRRGTKSSAAERERRKHMHHLVHQRKPHPYLRHQGPPIHRSSKRSSRNKHSRSHSHHSTSGTRSQEEHGVNVNTQQASNLPNATVIESPQSRKQKSRHRSRNSERWLEKMATYLNSPRTASGAIAVPLTSTVGGNRKPNSPNRVQQTIPTSSSNSGNGTATTQKAALNRNTTELQASSHLDENSHVGTGGKDSNDPEPKGSDWPGQSGSPRAHGGTGTTNLRGGRRHHRIHTVSSTQLSNDGIANQKDLKGQTELSSKPRKPLVESKGGNVSLPPIPSSKDLKRATCNGSPNESKDHDGSSGSEDPVGVGYGLAFPKSESNDGSKLLPGRPSSSSSQRSAFENVEGFNGPSSRTVAVPPVHQNNNRQRRSAQYQQRPPNQQGSTNRRTTTHGRNTRSLSPKPTRGEQGSVAIKERKTSALSRLNQKIATHSATQNANIGQPVASNEDSSLKQPDLLPSSQSPTPEGASAVATNIETGADQTTAKSENTATAVVEEASNEVGESSTKSDRKQRKKLERKWAELEFVLRKPIQSGQDINSIRRATVQSLQFLDALDSKAAELNVLRGTLSRMLLPYHENTAAATQRASTPVMGDSPLDSVMDLPTRKHMVNCANELRSLVRVKIADDADLDQARTAVCETKAFFDNLEDYATKKELDPFSVLCQL